MRVKDLSQCSGNTESAESEVDSKCISKQSSRGPRHCPCSHHTYYSVERVSQNMDSAEYDTEPEATNSKPEVPSAREFQAKETKEVLGEFYTVG